MITPEFVDLSAIPTSTNISAKYANGFTTEGNILQHFTKIKAFAFMTF